jgi:hypothetical protein
MAPVDLKMVPSRATGATYTWPTPVCALVKGAYTNGGSVRELQWSGVQAGKARMCW